MKKNEAQRLADTHTLEGLYSLLSGVSIGMDSKTGLALAAARKRYFSIDSAIELKKSKA